MKIKVYSYPEIILWMGLFGRRLLLVQLVFRNGDSKHSIIIHGSLYGIDLDVLRQFETLQDLVINLRFHLIPLIVYLFLIYAFLTAYMENRMILYFHLYLFYLESGKICLEDVSFRCLLPINLSIQDSEDCFVWKGQVWDS